MRRLAFLAAVVATALVAVPGSSALAAKKKPVYYEFAGGYTKTSVVYTHCDLVGGGTSGETLRVVRTFAYSGNSKSGIKIVETEQTFSIRDTEGSDYVKDSAIAGQKHETTRTVKGKEVLVQTKGTTGTISYDGIGSENQRQTFRLPKKGKVTEIKIGTHAQANDPNPGVGCDVAYDKTDVEGTIFARVKK